MDRRTFLLDAAAVGLATRFGFAQSPAPEAAPIVTTASGVLRGEVADRVRVFRGVPFAEPPVGPLRFRATRAVTPWKGVRDATRFAAEAMQPGGGAVPQSEDCLYLNVWTPADAGPHPVFVWIHGGGFTGGRSFDPLQDGERFAREGIVCVTVAYRLGVLGFLDVGPVLGAEYAGSANNAVRDLVMALTWLQANVAAFGGDPARVTVGGESAGAKLTDLLMGLPAARGLFAQMISESGGADRIFPAARAAEVGTAFGQAFMQSGMASSGSGAAGLLTAPARELIAAQERFIGEYPLHFPLRPEIDGRWFAEPPLDAIRAGNARGKRLLLGTNHDESAMFIGPHPSVNPSSKDLGNLPLARFGPIEERYAALYPEMPAELRRIRSVTAEEYWIPSMRVAEAQVAGGGTAFVYRFDHLAESGRYAGRAFHAEELAYVWENFEGRAVSTANRALAKTMHAAWDRVYSQRDAKGCGAAGVARVQRDGPAHDAAGCGEPRGGESAGGGAGVVVGRAGALRRAKTRRARGTNAA